MTAPSISKVLCASPQVWLVFKFNGDHNIIDWEATQKLLTKVLSECIDI
jgi:hypothetical protein